MTDGGRKRIANSGWLCSLLRYSLSFVARHLHGLVSLISIEVSSPLMAKSL
jgi:hypothetical protein